MTHFNLSNETISKIQAAGEVIGSLRGEEAIELEEEQIIYTCYFLYSIKANKFLVAISDSWDNTNYSLDSGSECPLFDTIEQAIKWWKNTYYENAYYNCGHNMTQSSLMSISEHGIDAPVMFYQGLDSVLGIDYDDCEGFVDEFCDDCIVVGYQERVEFDC